MGSMSAHAASATMLLLLAASVGRSSAFGASKLPPAEKSDIKYIRCQVCELLAKNMYNIYKDLKQENGKKFKEEQLIDAFEKVTDQVAPEGSWIAKVDLVERGDRLVAVEQQEVGQCGRECKTVRMAAQQVLGEHDTDIAEKLAKGSMTRAQLQNWLCYELSNACVAKPPPLPKGRAPGPPFTVMDPQEAEVQKTLAAMQAQGMGGEVYSREEAMARYMQMGGDDDFDLDDLDDMEGMPGGMYDEVLAGRGGAGEQGAPGEGALQEGVQKLAEVATSAYAKVKEGASTLKNMAQGFMQRLAAGKDTQHTAQEL